MTEEVKQFSWDRNLDYVKTSIILQLKGINEYKLNFYYGLFFTLVFSLINLFFLFLINNNFSILINWNRNEYLFFVIFSGIVSVFFSSFSWGSRLHQSLLNGELNNFATKPISIFLQYLLNTTILFLSFPSIIYFILLLYLIFIIMDTFSIFKLTLTFIFGFLGGFLFVIIFRLLDSIAFFMKNNVFLIQLYITPNNVFGHFPSIMFVDGKYGFLLFLFANTYYGAYATEFFFGHIGYNKLIFMSLILFSLILLFSIGIYLLWHYGLKKYEAFG